AVTIRRRRIAGRPEAPRILLFVAWRLRRRIRLRRRHKRLIGGIARCRLGRAWPIVVRREIGGVPRCRLRCGRRNVWLRWVRLLDVWLRRWLAEARLGRDWRFGAVLRSGP